MTCGEELKSYHTWRYLVLSEIALGLASRYNLSGVERLKGNGAPTRVPISIKLRIPKGFVVGVSLWEIISVDKRETARTAS